MSAQKNVLGTILKPCCLEIQTGFFRDGYCRTDNSDIGKHTVCAIMTQEFLEYTASKGNDLLTPNPLFGFPGLTPGDKWCLCALRWKEACEAGVAPLVDLEACHEDTLKVVSLDALLEKSYSEKTM